MIQTASLSSDELRDGMEVLTLNGDCDLSTALQTEQRIDAALEAGKQEIIVDLRGVTSLGRPTLQVLFRALIQMGHNGGLTLVRPDAHVWALFHEAGLDRGFTAFADLKAALAAVSSRGSQNRVSPHSSFRGIR
jgi:anti-sigma B factor antagonist